MLGSHKTAVTVDQHDAGRKDDEQARLNAEREADSIIASAAQLAQETVSRAKAEAEQLREEAARDKQKAISDVRGHIETIVAAAKDEAARIVADARRKAEEEARDIVARARRQAETLTSGLAEATKRDNGTAADAAGHRTGLQESGDSQPHPESKPRDRSGENAKPTASHAAGEHGYRLTRPPGAQPTASPPDESVLYYGEVEIRIAVPSDGAAVGELEDRLRTVAYLGLARPQPSESGSVSLVVHARAPTPLLRIVKSLAIVEKAVPAGKDIELTLHRRA